MDPAGSMFPRRALAITGCRIPALSHPVTPHFAIAIATRVFPASGRLASGFVAGLLRTFHHQRSRRLARQWNPQQPPTTRTNQAPAVVLSRHTENIPTIRADKSTPPSGTFTGLGHAPPCPTVRPIASKTVSEIRTATGEVFRPPSPLIMPKTLHFF